MRISSLQIKPRTGVVPRFAAESPKPEEQMDTAQQIREIERRSGRHFGRAHVGLVLGIFAGLTGLGYLGSANSQACRSATEIDQVRVCSNAQGQAMGLLSVAGGGAFIGITSIRRYKQARRELDALETGQSKTADQPDDQN